MTSTALLATSRPDCHSNWFDVRCWSPATSCAALTVVFFAHYFEHNRIRTRCGTLLVFWVAIITVHSIKFGSLISREIYKTHFGYIINFGIGILLAILIAIVEWLARKTTDHNGLHACDHEGLRCRLEDATVFSRLTFAWMSEIMHYGYNNVLTEDDLWDLREKDSAHANGIILRRLWATELKKKHPSLWIALSHGFGKTFALGGCFKVAHDVLAFVQPQLLRLLIVFVQSYDDPGAQPVARGIAIESAMFATSVLQTVLIQQYYQQTFHTGMRIRAALSGTMYQKSIVLSNEGRASQPTGNIINLMAVDTMRLQGSY